MRFNSGFKGLTGNDELLTFPLVFEQRLRTRNKAFIPFKFKLSTKSMFCAVMFL